MQMFIGGMNYEKRAKVFMVARLYLEGRQAGRLSLIDAVKNCKSIELILDDGKPRTIIRG